MENQITDQKELARLKKELAETTEYLESTLEHVNKLTHHISWMEQSIFWKFRAVYVRLKSLKPKNVKSLTVKGIHVLKTQGPLVAATLVVRYIRKGKVSLSPTPIIREDEYQKWIAENEVYDQEQVERDITHFALKPTISIITPVYNVPAQFLNACIQSVVDQSYPNWELCLHDDASTDPNTLKALKSWDGKDARIKISYGTKNEHICGASNNALQLATGDYVSLLDNDDIIAPHALYEFVRYLNAHPDAEFIYSDEDKLSEKGVRNNPYFRADWSPHLLRSLNYITHMVVIKKSIGDSIGWFRKGFEGAQDYDLFLRLSLKTKSIHHIPKILYHWRITETSTAGDVSIKGYAGDAGQRALEDYLTVAEIPYVEVKRGIGMTNYHPVYTIPENTLVSIIIPFKDKVELLKDCVDSLLKRSTYRNYELLLVDNNSEEEATARYLAKLDDPRIRLLEYKKPFNFSALNNWAAREAKGSYICFLNNDTKVIARDWIEEMLGLAIQPEVGAVGAKLLYEDNTIQHAGIVLGMTGLAGHVFAHHFSDTTYNRLSEFTNNFLAVTAACLMIDARKFWEVNGFNEEFTICGNDVNLGLDLHELGYYNVYTPYATLYHLESKTRDKVPPAGDYEISIKRYEPYLNFRDPFYNPNLSLLSEEVHVRMKDEQPIVVTPEMGL